jgi:hypothetical protein
MIYANMNIQDFIKHIVTQDSINDILNSCETSSCKGFVYERLYDIIIKFGFCDIFPNSMYNHVVGNVNTLNTKVLNNYSNYLNEKVISGNSSGCSDITLKNKITSEYIFISSKYSKNDKKVSSYNIQDIITMIDHNKKIYRQYKIYLIVPDKNAVLNKLKTTNKSSKYITNHITNDNMLDENDLINYFLKFKKNITKNLEDINSWTEIYLNSKNSLNLRFHQELITHKTLNLINKGNKSFLWGCKCRSGKTFMVGGLISKQYNATKHLNVMIITPAPTETAPQFTDELFNKFNDFSSFRVNNIEKLSDVNKIEPGASNIIVISKQLLQRHVDNNAITQIKNLSINYIFFDENHYGGTTSLSKQIMNTYSSKDTIKIYLTATFCKPLKEWDLLPECQMYWDIEDEQISKSILLNKANLSKLKDRHGKQYIDLVVNYYASLGLSIREIFEPYKFMPNLHLITNMFDSERYDIIKNSIMGSCYGFSFNVLLSLNKDGKFNYNNEIKTVLRYITGSEKEIDYKMGDKSIFARINKSSSRHSFTQLWFLPSENIDAVSQNLKLLMMEDKILKQYNILCVNRGNSDLAKNVKNEILNQETAAKLEGKLGLILLAGNMLNLGITINSCDIVILMNNTLSSDKVMQQMYRCMTEDFGKTCGFVVDLNISRVLQTVMNYCTFSANKTIEDKVNYLIENHLINIDIDMLDNKNVSIDVIINKLITFWKSDPINNFKMLLRNLDDDYIIFDNPTQKMVNKMFMNSIKTSNVSATIAFNDVQQDVQSGKCMIKQQLTGIDKEDTTKVVEISFTKDILPFIIPLACILTIQNNNKNFVKMLTDIKNDAALLEIFDDQCLIWWNSKNLINFVQTIVSKYFDKTSNVHNVSIQFKLSMQSLIDNPKEMLTLVAECLKPKVIEKKVFGEVFTPIEFINDKMLSDIEKYWKKKTKKNIWENEFLTWYDPAAGMGNYPIAIYYKLMNGLKTKIPNEMLRKKHIIEKQLYMGELNKKNCFILKQIFNIDGKLNLNLYEGDTLKINLQTVFSRKKFDIIIGNPPYNEELTKVGAKPLYNKFIEYYINKCNILSFIVPSRWFSGGKGLDKFRNMMINRTDIVYIKHFSDASKIFGNLVEIKGGVNYFLVDVVHNGLCEYNDALVKFNNFDIILDSKFYGLINKLDGAPTLVEIYMGRCFGIESNDKNLTDDSKLVKCYVSQQKGFVKYISKNHIKKDYLFYKVITARAAFGANSGFGNTFIGLPNEIHTGSYISFKVKSLEEAKSLESYMKCKLPNLLLSLRKSSQDISEATCKWIVLPPLNKIWLDNDIYKYFKLTTEEIKLVKSVKISGFAKN